MNATWHPVDGEVHHVLVLGPPQTEKVVGPDGKERFQTEMLVEVDGEVRVWRFGMSTFKQLHAIEQEQGLDNVWVEIRRTTDGWGSRIPRIEVVACEQRVS